MKHSVKDWFVVTRYWSFSVSTMPVLATFAYLCSRHLVPSGAAPIVNFILALVGIVLFHAAGNVLSDYYDFKRGVDNENAFAVPNLVFHKFEAGEYLRFSVILFVAAIVTGIAITLLSGPVVLLVGGLGFVLTVLYSFFKFHALGDLDIFIIFGILPILGTSYVVTGNVCWEALVLSIPIGIVTVSVLHANNTLDIDSDKAAGIRTFAMLLGGRFSSKLYMAYQMIPFIFVAAAVIAGALTPFSLLCLVALIPAFGNIKAASHFDEKGIQTMMGLDQASAKMQLVFSGLLSIGLFIGALI